jgi:hypothetical protein
MSTGTGMRGSGVTGERLERHDDERKISVRTASRMLSAISFGRLLPHRALDERDHASRKVWPGST